MFFRKKEKTIILEENFKNEWRTTEMVNNLGKYNRLFFKYLICMWLSKTKIITLFEKVFTVYRCTPYNN